MYKIGEKTTFMDLTCIESGLSDQEIEFLVSLFNEKNLVVPAGIGVHESLSEINLDVRRSNVIWIDPLTISKFKLEKIYEKIVNTVNHVNENFYKFDLMDIESLQLTQYHVDDNGFYNFHTDSDTFSCNLTRKLSFVIQLTDFNKFEGGEFVCNRAGNTVNVSKENPIFMKKGNLIAFPSFMPHQITPIIKGIRHSLVGWCFGPRFK